MWRIIAAGQGEPPDETSRMLVRSRGLCQNGKVVWDNTTARRTATDAALLYRWRIIR